MDLFEWIVLVAKIVVVLGGLLGSVAVMELVERRGSAFMQMRLGPNRVGPFGLLQPIADGIKFFFKEDPIPAHVEKFYYLIAPAVCLLPAVMVFAVIPFAAPMIVDGRQIVFQIADLNVGILYFFAVASLGIYGIIMAGWSSNNKYSLLGAMRSSSQMISYELSMGLSVVGIIMTFSSVQLGQIVQGQGEILFNLGPLAIPKWGILFQPLGFLVFLTAVFAETNRLPFDLPEGESEIIAGYHTEYGSMKFATFFMAEYMNMATVSALVATLFFGGWQMLPGLPWLHGMIASVSDLSPLVLDIVRVLFQIFSFTVKLAFFLWFFVWVRWTLPRFRYDQLMHFGWKVLLPLSLLNIGVTAGLIFYGVI